MRGLLFYLLAAAAAALMIGLSFGPRLFSPPPAEQAGYDSAGWRVFGPEALARVESGDQARIFTPLGAGGEAQGLRLVTRIGAGAPSAPSQAVRLTLSPEAIAALGPGPWVAEVKLKPLGITTAEGLMLGAVDEAGAVWADPQPAPAEPKTLRFELPATRSGALQAIAFWPTNPGEKYDLGVEIAQVRLRPGS